MNPLTVRKLWASLMLVMIMVSCHDDPDLPKTLIPGVCQVTRVELIDTTSRTTYTYQYDKNNNRLASNDWRGSRTFTYDADGLYIATQQINGTSLNYQYEGTGSNKRISRISGGAFTYTYIYEGNQLKTYIAQESITTTYSYTDGKLSSITRPGEILTVQNGRIIKREAGSNTYNYLYNNSNQLTQLEIRTPDERRVETYTYDAKYAYQNSGLLMRGFPGSAKDGQPGPGLDPPGEPIMLNNLLTLNTKIYRPVTASNPISDITLRYTHSYYNEYSLGYARSDGARAKYLYANCN